eukprot:185932_1
MLHLIIHYDIRQSFEAIASIHPVIIHMDVDTNDIEEIIESEDEQPPVAIVKPKKKHNVCKNLQTQGSNGRLIVTIWKTKIVNGNTVIDRENGKTTKNLTAAQLGEAIKLLKQHYNMNVHPNQLVVPEEDTFPISGKTKLKQAIKDYENTIALEPFNNGFNHIRKILAPKQRAKHNRRHIIEQDNQINISHGTNSYKMINHRYKFQYKRNENENQNNRNRNRNNNNDNNGNGNNNMDIVATQGTKSATCRTLRILYFKEFESDTIHLKDCEIIMLCLSGNIEIIINQGESIIELSPLESLRLIEPTQFSVRIKQQEIEASIFLTFVNTNISKAR